MIRILTCLLAALVLAPGPAQAKELVPGAAPAKAKDYREYMAFGDSITAGYEDPTGHYTAGYPSHANLRGTGMGGYTAEAAAAWWRDYIEDLPPRKRPAVAVFLTGINDLNLGADAATVIERLRNLRRIGRELDIRVVFGTIVPAPLDSVWRHMEAERRLVNQWIRHQPTFVNYARPLTCEPSQHLCDYFEHSYYHDVHPNDAGQEQLGLALRRWVEEDVEQPPPGDVDDVDDESAPDLSADAFGDESSVVEPEPVPPPSASRVSRTRVAGVTRSTRVERTGCGHRTTDPTSGPQAGRGGRGSASTGSAGGGLK